MFPMRRSHRALRPLAEHGFSAASRASSWSCALHRHRPRCKSARNPLRCPAGIELCGWAWHDQFIRRGRLSHPGRAYATPHRQPRSTTSTRTLAGLAALPPQHRPLPRLRPLRRRLNSWVLRRSTNHRATPTSPSGPLALLAGTHRTSAHITQLCVSPAYARPTASAALLLQRCCMPSSCPPATSAALTLTVTEANHGSPSSLYEESTGFKLRSINFEAMVLEQIVASIVSAQ